MRSSGREPRAQAEERPVCGRRTWPLGGKQAALVSRPQNSGPQRLDALLPFSQQHMPARGMGGAPGSPGNSASGAPAEDGCRPVLGPPWVHIPVPAARAHVQSAEGGPGMGAAPGPRFLSLQVDSGLGASHRVSAPRGVCGFHLHLVLGGGASGSQGPDYLTGLERTAGLGTTRVL